MRFSTALMLAAFMLVGTFAFCQEAPKVEIAIDYSYMRYNPAHKYTQQGYSLNGGGGAIDFNFNRYFGLKMDLAGYGSTTKNITYKGISANVQGNLFTYMFGPQVGLRTGKVRPFAHLLFGGAHSNVYANAYKDLQIASKAPSGNAFAMAFGGGLDIPITKSGSVMIRPGEASYVLTRFNNNLSSNQNNFRYAAGLVFNLGLPSPVPPKATCSVTPAELLPWEGPVTATVQPMDFNPKHTLAYAWNSTGGTVTGEGTSAKIDTATLSPGSYTVSSSVSDPRMKKQAPVPCSASFTVKTPRPPVITCSADPSTVQPGEPVTLTAQGVSPDHQPLKDRSFSASAGSVRESQTNAGNEPGSFVSKATLDTTGVPAGTVNVTLNVTDIHGLTGTCVASVNVQAPPPAPPPPPKSSKLSQCDFPNKVKPWRVDNTCKAILDDVALRLQQEVDAKLVIVGNAEPTEKRENLAAERALNSKAYLSGGEAKQAIDPSRIETRTGNAGTKTAEYWVVPAGATFDSTGTEPVDESKVKPVPDHPAKKKPAAPKT